MVSNHDDAIASLMNEMREQQGYSQAAASESPTTTTKKDTTYQRLLPELDDYPDNSRCAGSHSIWNPHVLQKYLPSCSSTISIPTNPQVEVLRRRAFEKFKQECLEGIQRISSTWNLKLPIPSMLEKWHMDAKLQERQQHDKKTTKDNSSPQEEYPRMASTRDIHRLILQQQESASYYDPILLYKQVSSPLFVPTFRQEVEKGWKKTPHPPKLAKKSQQVQKNLHRLICLTMESFQQQLHQTVNQLAIRSTDARKRPKINHLDDDQVDVIYSGVSYRVHSAYFEKLQRLFDRAGNNNVVSFEEALFCLLCRYDMLQGAGLQAGVPGKIMDVLLERLDCRMECFASPLNCRYQNYASAFPDVDGCFGSVGNFFQLDFSKGGCYQANPPFCEGLIAQMNDTIRKWLHMTSTSTTKVPLMFVVFVPAWKESVAYQQLLFETTNDNDNFLTNHLLLEQGKHWYTEGTQHRRKGSFRVASFDTSIFFYQNDAAKSKWTIDDSLLEELKEAFCQDPGVMEKSTSMSITNPKTKPTLPMPMPIERTTERKEPAVAETSVPPPSSNPISPPTKGSKKVKGSNKRNWSKDHKEENEKQLDLLQSLGLMSNSTDEPKQEEDTPETLTKKPSKKKTKKRR